MFKRMEKYYAKHMQANAGVHAILGLGMGILITHPLVDPHPVRWGILIVALGLLAHLWAGTQK